MPEQRQGRTITSRTIFGIGFKDKKDDDASNDLLLRIAAGAAHAERGVRLTDEKMENIFCMRLAPRPLGLFLRGTW
jgi:hypothetical protein